MTTNQLLIVIIGIALVTLALLIELSESHITRADIAALVAFFSGAGLVLAFNHAGKG